VRWTRPATTLLTATTRTEETMIGYLTLGTNDLPRAAVFYAGYFRDLDGNKLNVFCMG